MGKYPSCGKKKIFLSIFPVMVFAHAGYYVMRRFSYYSTTTDVIEMGNGTGEGNGLHHSVALEV